MGKWFFKRRPATKSSHAKRIARKLGVPVIEIKLSRVDPMDLRGLPVDA